jgi:WD repeat-containing protein 19
VLRSNVHGVGAVQFKWDPQGKFLASVGVNRRVNIFRRNGETYDEFALQEDGYTRSRQSVSVYSGFEFKYISLLRPVQQLQWDNEGEVLAVLQPQGQNITLYEIAAKKATLLPLTQQNPSYMVWSRTGPQLAVGTSKGNLIIYNKITRKRLPISGLHSKPIVCGNWNHENKLALASIDRTVSFSLFSLYSNVPYSKIAMCRYLSLTRKDKRSTPRYFCSVQFSILEFSLIYSYFNSLSKRFPLICNFLT